MFQTNNQTKLIKLSTGFTLSDSIPDYWFLPDLCADPVNPHVLKSVLFIHVTAGKVMLEEVLHQLVDHVSHYN